MTEENISTKKEKYTSCEEIHKDILTDLYPLKIRFLTFFRI